MVDLIEREKRSWGVDNEKINDLLKKQLREQWPNEPERAREVREKRMDGLLDAVGDVFDKMSVFPPVERDAMALNVGAVMQGYFTKTMRQAIMEAANYKGGE
jgi:hypothetical protein